MKEQDPILGIQRFFEKEGAKEKGDTDFEIGDLGTKIACRACLLFYRVFGDKKEQLLKALLTCAFIP